jgi:hypothetical protein
MLLNSAKLKLLLARSTATAFDQAAEQRAWQL